MPTRDEVAAENASMLTADQVEHLLPAIRASAIYNKLPGLYPNLKTDLMALVGVAVYKAYYIKAIITILDGLTDAEVELAGGRSAIYFDLEKNRERQIELLLSALYDTAMSAAASGLVERAAIGQLGCACLACGCHPCRCGGCYA